MSAVTRSVLSGRREHNTLVLPVHILGLCAGLLAYRGQYALGRKQRSQQRGTRIYGPAG